MSHACVTLAVTTYSNLTQVITNDNRSFSHRNFKLWRLNSWKNTKHGGGHDHGTQIQLLAEGEI